jgi:hypothetical protein
VHINTGRRSISYELFDRTREKGHGLSHTTPQNLSMSSEPTATESAAAQSIAGQPQSSDDLKVKQDGGVEQVKEGEQKEGGDKTVFDDAGNFNVKVSLELKSCSVADWCGGE